MQFTELASITNGILLQCAADHEVVHLVLDSRKAVVHESSVFFAIRGNQHDGHRYIEDLHTAGMRQFVVEDEIDFKKFRDANFLRVQSAVLALQQVAAAHRSAFSFPVIGITGSNGKTIVKEWLFQLLTKEFTIVKNPGSYNSQVGVPLSVWQTQPYHTLGIFEAGISKPGEMKNLEPIIKPTLGIFTNVGTAHDENFDSTKEKIHEKTLLFKNVTRLICCAEHEAIVQAAKAKAIPLLTWGFSSKADIRISKYPGSYSVAWEGKQFDVAFPFSDSASVENAFHCIAAMLQLGIKESLIQERVQLLRAIPMRLELKEGINQCRVIDDTYNNDLGGLQISLDFLSGQQQKSIKTLILSDIHQSGLMPDALTDHVARMVNQSGVKKFIGVGPILQQHAKKFTVPSLFFNSTDEFLREFSSEGFQHEIILVKGARTFQFEKIVSRLQRKVHGTVMEVNLGSLVSNLNYFKSKLSPATKVMVMVKAFAYGSGAVEVANVLQYHRVDYLGVAYADEGVELRKNNITLPIMVMNTSEDGFQSMIQYNLEPEIYGFKILNEFIGFLNGRLWKVHLKIDTGMHRLGFAEEDIDELLKILRGNSNLRVASVFTHLAGSDEAEHDAFSQQQALLFMRCASKIASVLGHKPDYHILNTPGILRLPEWQLDMVRLGVGLYGVDPTTGKHPLKPVATLKTVISQIRTLKAGESVGYGRKGKAINDMTLATIAIGYADGYNRAFSRGVGSVLVNGHRARVVGNVCMDMTMIDITGIPAKEGDEVIIFGEQLSIDEVAASIHTIPYEILTNTSERVKRIFVAESI